MGLSATCAQPEDEEAHGSHAFSVTGHHARKLIEAQYFLRLGLVPVIEIGTMAEVETPQLAGQEAEHHLFLTLRPATGRSARRRNEAGQRQTADAPLTGLTYRGLEFFLWEV